VLVFEDSDDEDEFDETKRQVSRLYDLLSNGHCHLYLYICDIARVILHLNFDLLN